MESEIRFLMHFVMLPMVRRNVARNCVGVNRITFQKYRYACANANNPSISMRQRNITRLHSYSFLSGMRAAANRGIAGPDLREALAMQYAASRSKGERFR